MPHPDNYVGKDQPDELDLLIREEAKKNGTLAPGWLPFEVYDMVQSGYPYPDHGVMIVRPDSGTDRAGQLLPPTGCWVKAEDVRAYLDAQQTEKEPTSDEQ